MKPDNNLTQLLVRLLGIFVIFGLVAQVVLVSPTYHYLDNKSFILGRQLKDFFISKPVLGLKEWRQDLAHLKNLEEENRLLRKQLSQLAQLQMNLDQKERDIKELTSLLQLRQAISQFTVVSANLIGRDVHAYDQDLVLNVGRKQGIDIAMVVMTPQGVVGQVAFVEEESCVVRLLTAQKDFMALAVKVVLDEQSESQAILEAYDDDHQVFKVRLLNTNVSLQKGQKVVTSGLGDRIPGGLVVGTIEEIHTDKAGMSILLDVKPMADFYDFNYVMVAHK